MIKRILFALAALLSLSPAYAQEINPDVGMDTPGAWMPETGWSVTGSKGVATSVTSMKMLMQMNSAIKEGSRYRVTFTVSGATGGEVRTFAGVSMPSAPAGSWITLASVSDIADNFTTSLGTTTTDREGVTLSPKASLTGPGDSAEQGGAFRFGCHVGKYGWVDPLVNPGTNAPHLHAFFGNNGVGKSWTFTDFRTKGSTTCGENDTVKGTRYAVNRSGYWMPAFLDGLGNALRPTHITVYYKGPSNPALNYTGHISTEGDPAVKCAAESYAGDCQNIPRGLRMISGYKSTDGTCGPADTTCNAGNNTGSGTSAVSKLGGSNLVFDCWERATGNPIGSIYTSLAALKAANVCTSIGAHEVHVGIDFPSCWNGTHVDSADHRSHMSYTVAGKCPSTHPVRIPTIAVMAFFPIDQAFLDGKWHLSSDEMVNGAVAGSTLHFDYWEGWSPTIRQRWYDKCILAHNSCGGPGELGDGTAVGGLKDWDGTIWGCNGCAKVRPDARLPLTSQGMSKSYTANGTYTVELTSVGDGVWGLMGLNGFSGAIDNVSIQRISTGKGPVTATGSGG